MLKDASLRLLSLTVGGTKLQECLSGGMWKKFTKYHILLRSWMRRWLQLEDKGHKEHRKSNTNVRLLPCECQAYPTPSLCVSVSLSVSPNGASAMCRQKQLPATDTALFCLFCFILIISNAVSTCLLKCNPNSPTEQTLSNKTETEKLNLMPKVPRESRAMSLFAYSDRK